MKNKIIVLMIAVALIFSTSSVRAESNLAASSTIASLAILIPVSASLLATEVLPETSELIVDVVKTVGESTEIVLKSSATGAEYIFKTTANLSGTGLVTIGESLVVVTGIAGYALEHSGKMIAFVPNELGQSMIHHSEHSGAQ